MVKKGDGVSTVIEYGNDSTARFDPDQSTGSLDLWIGVFN